MVCLSFLEEEATTQNHLLPEVTAGLSEDVCGRSLPCSSDSPSFFLQLFCRFLDLNVSKNV